ncbi:MoaD/ThiS family protein [Fretibacter rubidus]|uniref:MoaD/ThiS family protein n=1 Tax=Fretibacter rubidus TaxID=570162 RepID=UPI00352BCDD2
MAIVTVEFFGRLTDRMGKSVSFDAAATATLGTVRTQLAKNHDCDDLLDPSVRGVINDIMVADDTQIKLGDSLAFFSPLSGG